MLRRTFFRKKNPAPSFLFPVPLSSFVALLLSSPIRRQSSPALIPRGGGGNSGNSNGGGSHSWGGFDLNRQRLRSPVLMGLISTDSRDSWRRPACWVQRQWIDSSYDPSEHPERPHDARLPESGLDSSSAAGPDPLRPRLLVLNSGAGGIALKLASSPRTS